MNFLLVFWRKMLKSIRRQPMNQPEQTAPLPFLQDYEPPYVMDIEFCDNRGCAWNKKGRCGSKWGQCYGYMPVEDKS